MGGGRGKGVRALMTFSLWNLISIVSAVNILPRNSTCHHDHTGSELLNARRWYYTLYTHADDLIPVRLRYFFSVICQCQQTINSSQVIHYVTHSRMWSMPRIVPTNPSSLVSTLSAYSPSTPRFWVHDPFGVHVGTWLRESKLFTAVSHDFEHMVSHPREWKKLHFQMLAVLSNLFYGWFYRTWSQAKKCQVRVREQKQRNRNGSSELGVFVCAWVGVYCSLIVSVHVSMCPCCMCVVLGCSGRWNHAPPRTGSPWLALTRIADHINATTHLSLLPFLPASCSLLLLPSADCTCSARRYKTSAQP